MNGLTAFAYVFTGAAAVALLGWLLIPFFRTRAARDRDLKRPDHTQRIAFAKDWLQRVGENRDFNRPHTVVKKIIAADLKNPYSLREQDDRNFTSFFGAPSRPTSHQQFIAFVRRHPELKRISGGFPVELRPSFGRFDRHLADTSFRYYMLAGDAGDVITSIDAWAKSKRDEWISAALTDAAIEERMRALHDRNDAELRDIRHAAAHADRLIRLESELRSAHPNLDDEAIQDIIRERTDGWYRA